MSPIASAVLYPVYAPVTMFNPGTKLAPRSAPAVVARFAAPVAPDKPAPTLSPDL